MLDPTKPLRLWQRSGEPADGECAPRWMTPRNPRRETRGPELVRISRLLGVEPLPWQRDLFDVAYEIDPQTGSLWYGEIVVLVPRQSGKTTSTLSINTHRAAVWPHAQQIVYIAQDGIRTVKKWEEQVLQLQASPFRQLIKPNRMHELEPNRTNGRQHLDFVTGSQWWPDVPSEDAGHGSTNDLGFIDEYWSQVDDRVEKALRPTMITVDDSQLWYLSTVGESKIRSAPLWAKMQAGRNRVESKLESHSLYVEYSAPPDADPMDRLTWWHTMPALGYTQSIRKITDELEQDTSKNHSLFKRSFLNIWPDESTDDWPIPRDAVAACTDPRSTIPEDTNLVWCVDIAPDRSAASIAVAAVRADNIVHLEIVDHGPGTDWVIDGDDRPSSDPLHLHGIKQLTGKWGGRTWFDWQTVGSLAPQFAAHGIDAQPLPASEIRVAAPGLYDAILNKQVALLGQSELADALSVAQRRPIGDGWGWARGKSLKEITPLMAITLAHRALAKDMPDWGYDPLSGIW